MEFFRSMTYRFWIWNHSIQVTISNIPLRALDMSSKLLQTYTTTHHTNTNHSDINPRSFTVNSMECQRTILYQTTMADLMRTLSNKESFDIIDEMTFLFYFIFKQQILSMLPQNLFCLIFIRIN